MQEHKRERTSIEARLNAVEKRAQYHDEHITIVDAWFSEVRDTYLIIVLVTESTPVT